MFLNVDDLKWSNAVFFYKYLRYSESRFSFRRFHALYSAQSQKLRCRSRNVLVQLMMVTKESKVVFMVMMVEVVNNGGFDDF